MVTRGVNGWLLPLEGLGPTIDNGSGRIGRIEQWEALFDPALHPALEVVGVVTALPSESGGEAAPLSNLTDEHDRDGAIELIDALGQLLQGDVARALDMAGFPFVGLPNIYELELPQVLVSGNGVHMTSLALKHLAEGAPIVHL